MIMSTFLEAIASLLHTVITAYIWVIIAAAVISWVRPDPYNPIVQVLRRLTEPVFDVIRRRLPTVFGGLDLTPIVLLLVLQFIDLFLIKLLFSYAHSL